MGRHYIHLLFCKGAYFDNQSAQPVTGKPLYLLRPRSLSIQIVSNIFVKFSNFMSPGGGAFDPHCSVPGEGFCTL